MTKANQIARAGGGLSLLSRRSRNTGHLRLPGKMPMWQRDKLVAASTVVSTGANASVSAGGTVKAAELSLSNIRAASRSGSARAVADAFSAAAELGVRVVQQEYGRHLLRTGVLVVVDTVLAKYEGDSAVEAAAVAFTSVCTAGQSIGSELRSGGDCSVACRALYALQEHGKSAATSTSALELLLEALPCQDSVLLPLSATADEDLCDRAAGAAYESLSRHPKDVGVINAGIELLCRVVDSWNLNDKRLLLAASSDSSESAGAAQAGAPSEAKLACRPLALPAAAKLARFACSKGLVSVISAALQRHAATEGVIIGGSALMARIYAAVTLPAMEGDAAARTHLRAQSVTTVNVLAAALGKRGVPESEDGCDAFTYLLHGICAVLEAEQRESRCEAAAALAGSAALPVLLGLLSSAKLHPDGELVHTALCVLERLCDAESVQPDLARAGTVEALAKLLARHQPVCWSSLRCTVSAICCSLLDELSRNAAHDKALLHTTSVTALAEVLPSQPARDSASGGANADELRCIANAASALSCALSRNFSVRTAMDIKLVAPDLEAKLAAWMPVLTERVGFIDPAVGRAKALHEMLNLVHPAASAPASGAHAGGAGAGAGVGASSRSA